MSTEIKCTCPSGDGSLRWPCPAHPPVLTGAAIAVQPFVASDLVFGHPRELFRVTPAGDVVVSEGVSTTDAARAFWDAVAQLRPAPTELDRARETPRRQSAVELLLSLGYVWRTDRWEAPQPAVAPALNEHSGNSGQLQPDAGSGGDALAREFLAASLASAGRKKGAEAVLAGELYADTRIALRAIEAALAARQPAAADRGDA